MMIYPLVYIICHKREHLSFEKKYLVNTLKLEPFIVGFIQYSYFTTTFMEVFLHCKVVSYLLSNFPINFTVWANKYVFKQSFL